MKRIIKINRFILRNAPNSQKEATISTDVKLVKLEYKSGEEKTITLVIKTLDYVNSSDKKIVIEHIPKEIVESTDELTILTPHTIIKKDPIIQFENPEEIIYYVNSEKSLSGFEKVNTVIIPDNTKKSGLFSITGNVISPFTSEFNGVSALIVLVIVLVILYIGYYFGLFEKIKFIYFLLFGDKRLHSMNMLINDANDNVDVGSYDKAYLIYREMKLFYDKLSRPAKNQIYKSVVEVCERLDYGYAKNLIKKIAEQANNRNMNSAKRLYSKLRSTYKKLDDKDKKKIFSEMDELFREFESNEKN